MADAGFYRGTSSEQDSRFTDKQRKLLKQMRFETSLDTKINLKRVNLDVIKPWITKRINEILGLEDDVVIEYVFSQLEEQTLDPKIMQINLTGFLNAKRSREFMGELWQLMVDAQNTEDGIPAALVKMKMQQMQKDSEVDNISRRYRRAEDRSMLDDDRRRRPNNPPPAAPYDADTTGRRYGTVADQRADAGNDWRHRYQSLTQGKYSGPTEQQHQHQNQQQQQPQHQPEPPVVPQLTPPRRRAFDERERHRDEKPKRKHERRSRSPVASRRRFTEHKSSDSTEQPTKRRRFTEKTSPVPPPPAHSSDEGRHTKQQGKVKIESNNGTKNYRKAEKSSESEQSSEDEKTAKKKKRKSRRETTDGSDEEDQGKKRQHGKKSRKQAAARSSEDGDLVYGPIDTKTEHELRKKALKSRPKLSNNESSSSDD